MGCTNSGGAKSQAATSVTSFDGDTIDLTDFPLKYGGDDKSLSDAQRKRIEDFEKKRVTSKRENMMILDADGNPTLEKHGGRGSIRTDTRDWRGADVMSHNHPRPRDGAVLGGTFSYNDLDTFSKTSTRTMRAAATEGTYSITKGKNFDAQGFKNYAKGIEQKHYQAYRKTANELKKQYKNSSMSYDEYAKKADAAFNKMLVDSHNELLAGQKTYGYNYTLERRR